MAVVEWRVERSGVPGALAAQTRLRAPYRILRAVFGDDGDFRGATGTKTSTSWFLKKRGSTTLVFLHDRQEADNRKFSLDAFRARQSYDWHVTGKDDACLKDFCTWLSREVIRRVEAEPQPKKLTARSKEKVNALIAQGKSVADAMKLAAEWEIIAPAAQAYKWPIAAETRDS